MLLFINTSALMYGFYYTFLYCRTYSVGTYTIRCAEVKLNCIILNKYT